MQRLPARRVTRWMSFAAVIATATTASSARNKRRHLPRRRPKQK